MSDEPVPNGVATPVSPKLSGLALTEYTAAPTPPGERVHSKIPGLPPNWGIPEAFLLPNGYPDVRYTPESSTENLHSNQLFPQFYSIFD